MMLREAGRNAGFQLFARKHGRLQPTAETTVIMADLDRLFDGIDRINRMVSEMKDVNIGTVHISATPDSGGEPLAARHHAQCRRRGRISR